ncbi:MAG: hypothetical protein ACO1RA_17335 [Planctomycetaceae bacterium]
MTKTLRVSIAIATCIFMFIGCSTHQPPVDGKLFLLTRLISLVPRLGEVIASSEIIDFDEYPGGPNVEARCWRFRSGSTVPLVTATPVANTALVIGHVNKMLGQAGNIRLDKVATAKKLEVVDGDVTYRIYDITTDAERFVVIEEIKK